MFTKLLSKLILVSWLVALGVVFADINPELATSSSLATNQTEQVNAEMSPMLKMAFSESVGLENEDYHIESTESGANATNSSHDYGVSFDANGVTVQAGADTWSMQVTSFGRDTHQETVAPAELTTTGNRATYTHEGWTEWYVNGSMGLQQGFTLDSAPDGLATDLVQITLDLSGTMQADLRSDTLHLTGENGTQLTYGGLYAFDANGQELSAQFELDGNQLAIIVDDQTATYPIIIDPWIEQQILVGNSSNDHFGISVALDGDTALIGADGDDDAGSDRGAAYVFVRSGGTWAEQQKLTASDTADNDEFGGSVALDGDTALIGADGDDDDGADSGSVYVFVRSGGTWTEQQKLTASDAASSDQFGSSVALDGNTAVIGAHTHNGGGRAYVFVEDGSWSEQQILIASDAVTSDLFGRSVALDGNTAVIGANGDDDDGDSSGSAYVFVRSGVIWSEQQKLTASDAASSHGFGISVALDGDTVIVGADNTSAQGRAYVFVRSGVTWSEQQKLTASDAANGDRFGGSVAVWGDMAVVGSHWDDDVASASGSAYVFERSGVIWSERQKITASDPASFDFFGQSVVVDSDTLIVGANQADASYVFDIFPSVNLSTDSVNVGEDGTTATLDIALDTAPTADVTVNVAFSGGAPNGAEISSPVAPFVIPSGTQGPLTLTIAGLDDALFEGVHSDTLTFSVSSVDTDYDGGSVPFSGGGGAGNNEVTVNITDNDTQPEISLSSVNVTHDEGDAGTTAYNFTMTLSNPSSEVVTVDYSTTDDTATIADSDYVDNDNTLTFNPGDPLTQTITVLVNGDEQFETDEDFTVSLDGSTNSTIDGANDSATGTITNDDTQPVVILNAGILGQNEGNSGTTAFVLTMTLSNASSEAVTVDFTTNDGTATVAEGDYVDNDNTLTFNPGDPLTQNFTIDVNGDTDFEANEYFTLTLVSSTNSTLSINQNYGLVIIVNDEAGTPNDGLMFFDPTSSDMAIYDAILDNPDEYIYTNTPPTSISPEWIMGDWNGNGEKTPGYFDSGAFRYTNDMGPTPSWSVGFWLGNAPGRVGIVAGRFATGFANDNGNDCIGWVDSNTNGAGDLRFSLKYWCDMTTTPQSIGGTLATQWLAAVLSDSQGFSGTHQWVYGDWDNDGLDEPGVRRGEFITRSTNAPSEGAALYGAGMAQRWAGTGGASGPGGHGLDDGVFVAGDWNGDGTDTWGVVYDDDTFYYRDVFGFNPGPFEFSSQTFTSSISAPRQVDSHHNASGGSSSPAPAIPLVLRDGEVNADSINPATVDTSRNVEADLSVSKAGNYTLGEVGLVGDAIVWTITVSNTGTAPANRVQIIDNVPSELRVDDALSDNGTISVRSQSVTFTAESIGVGETVQFQVVTTILSRPNSGSFANSVNVVIPDGNGSGSDANLVASGTIESVDELPATGYPPKLRW